jgi:hypothetical protein
MGRLISCEKALVLRLLLCQVYLSCFVNIALLFRTYRLSQNIKPLIWVECHVDKHSRSRTEYLVKARSQFKERSTATSVEILLPLPPDAISPTVRTSQASRSCR